MAPPGGGLPPGLHPGMIPPPGMRPPPANLGPVTVPQHNPGNVMQAVQKLSAALAMIEEAVPMIPMGSPEHERVLKIATDLGKHIGEAKSSITERQATLADAMRNAASQSQMAALSRFAPRPSGPAMPPPVPSPTPQPA